MCSHRTQKACFERCFIFVVTRVLRGDSSFLVNLILRIIYDDIVYLIAASAGYYILPELDSLFSKLDAEVLGVFRTLAVFFARLRTDEKQHVRAVRV